jgi:TRAP-type C4-dicarboxylate transport system permease small subunit
MRMTLLVINAVSVACAIIMAWASGELYRLTRSVGVLILFIGCLYLTIVRLVIAGAETFSPSASVLNYRSYLIASFWPLMAVGFLLLLRSLRRLYQNGYAPSTVPYEGPDRRRK